jgi:hypothetical protein
MFKAIIIMIVLCVTALVQAQEQRRPPREVWNEVYTKRQGREFPHKAAAADWERSGQEAPIVRFLAVREHAASDTR